MFNARYYSDAQIWSIIDDIVAERDEVQNALARPEVSTDPETMPDLARRLYELDDFCHLVEQLKKSMEDVEELEAILAEASARSGEQENPGAEDDFVLLHQEYLTLCQEQAGQVYHWLLENGYLDQEREDDMDLKILNFFDYAGAEYAWRLGINVGIDVEEARRRIEILLDKGLLERVEGTMINGYHRQKNWVKHMNHTYYQISRQGRLYLRELRREEESVEPEQG